MSSAFWLILYLLPLLGLTAAVFAWLGWQWRGQQFTIAPAETPVAAPTVTEPVETSAPSLELQKELRTSQHELTVSRAESKQHQEQAAEAIANAKALGSELAELRREMEALRAERDQLAADLNSSREEITRLQSRPPAASVQTDLFGATADKSRRGRTTPARPKKAALNDGTLADKIAALDEQLAQQQAGMPPLTQERDGWQKQVARLEEQTPPDAAGLGLARRSLADSTQRLDEATHSLETLQHQVQMLKRVEEAAAALTSVPDDDLTQIKGIKKVISEQLKTHGIRTWRQIALWDDEELRIFSELLGFKNRATREKWKEQARALHEAAHGPLS